MAKKQTRRSVSLNRQVFDDAKAAAAAAGMSLSQYVEAALKAKDPIRAMNRDLARSAKEFTA